MKKALIGVASLLFMAAAGIGGYAYYQQQEQQLPLAVLENLEAVSNSETGSGGRIDFVFNGQNWWGDKSVKPSPGNWYPSIGSCYDHDYGKQGSLVHCTDGDGNCWNGTNCITM